ncbi:MAG TPA: radical SAM protein [Firmicutes bacterium]|jgi:pyruvate-formate lyase-activating enzyme|nr:radical SAM protein [Bacillota bacterium]
MSSEPIRLLYADQDGHLYTDPELLAVGINGSQAEIADQSWIDLPSGGEALLLPGRLPLGYHEGQETMEVVEGYTAVAAILPVGLTRCLLPGYEIATPQELPLFGYTAVGTAGDRLKVAAIQTDEDLKWNPNYYNTSDLPRLIGQKTREYPDNRILSQLAKCAMEYHCLTAQNIFYSRWEAGIPVSPVCNANCLGCISKQPSECCPSPQGRIEFIPTVQEIVELGVAHLESAADAIISFGQGCEGEPSLQRELLVKAIGEIRRQTTKGTININSNAGYFDSIRELVDNGLDSIRVSLFSARPENYQWYHQPQNYQFEAVKQSLAYAADHGAGVALNLLLYPGFTNDPRESEALYRLLRETKVQQVQLRNLNLDPERLMTKIAAVEVPTIEEWIGHLKKEFPKLLIGNYTLPKR